MGRQPTLLLKALLTGSLLLGASACAAAPIGTSAPLRFEDADRFARLLQAHPTPSATQLQAEYIAPGSAGLKIFTPYRIIDADNLAAKIAAHPVRYRKALDLCPPLWPGA